MAPLQFMKEYQLMLIGLSQLLVVRAEVGTTPMIKKNIIFLVGF